MLENVWLNCPYCGEAFEAEVDCSPGGQHYIEDCPICCRPIEIVTEIGSDGTLAGIEVRRDDD